MIIPKLRAPIVLVHGFFGFDRIRMPGVGWTMANYFPKIPELLRSVGNRVLIPTLSPTGGVADRARQLKEFLNRESPDEPVHLFAHSMGGLDSRYMVSCLRMEKRVLTITTLGTPHRGTSFADWGIQKLERVVRPVLEVLTIPTQGFYDLTRAECQKFNEVVPDVSGIRYFSVAGRHAGQITQPAWLLPYNIVYQEEGDNDGVVSVASAKWGEDFEIWDGDHFSLVNWLNFWGRNRGFWRDPGPRYGPLVRRLADLGY
jgi:triacylglycerol lipase